MKTMSRAEFIALIATLFATIAFSIDAMLPALPEIGAELSPGDVNRAQLILTSFVLGMGLGTFFTGPLSDWFGRKPVMICGAVIYMLASLVAIWADRLEIVLLARVLQGLGASGPRVVAMAVVRDLYAGRQMARIISLAMMIFTLIPAFAPLIGSAIIALSDWRGIFVSFVLFSALTMAWMMLRLPESLPPENRRALRAPLLWDAVRQMFAHPIVRLSIFVQTLCMGILFSMLTLVQPIYDITFDRAESFPYWFGVVALISGGASLLNAWLVVRVGMRRMVSWSLGAQIGLAGSMILLEQLITDPALLFPCFLFWQTCVFFMAGTTLGNLTAIALEPMGHIAGMGASVIGSFATVGSVMIAAPLGQTFTGPMLPLTLGTCVMSVLGFALMRRMGQIEVLSGL